MFCYDAVMLKGKVNSLTSALKSRRNISHVSSRLQMDGIEVDSLFAVLRCAVADGSCSSQVGVSPKFEDVASLRWAATLAALALSGASLFTRHGIEGMQVRYSDNFIHPTI